MSIWHIKDIHDYTYIFESIDEVIKYVFDKDYYIDESSTEDYLDDEYGSIEILGEWYPASEILRMCDEDKYQEEINNYAEQRANEDADVLYDEIKNLDDGAELNINGFSIKRIPDSSLEEISKNEFSNLICST